MRYEDFVERVNSGIGGGGTAAEAEMAIAATLATFGERISGGEAENLAAQLPPEIRDHLENKQAEKAGDFPLEEFYWRVATKEGIQVQTAASHAQAVMRVVGEAATGDELEGVKSQLPREFEQLFA